MPEKGWNVSAQTFLMDLKTQRWQEEPFLPLNVTRYLHASLGLGNQAYVACGTDKFMTYLRSVEMLRIGAQAWDLIDVQNLKPRTSPILCHIDGYIKICILGGGTGYLKPVLRNGVILNAKTCSVVKYINNPIWQMGGFACYSQSF